MDFIAIDFETADRTRHNPCEIGITVVKNWKIQDYSSWLIKPSCYPDFDSFIVNIHNITPDMVANDRTFDQLWPEIQHYFEYPIIAHNAKFDIDVLVKTLEHHNLVVPSLRYYCSLELAQEVFPALPSHSLDTVCSLLGIELENHHSAGPDARATAEIVIRLCKHFGITSIDDLTEFGEGSIDYAAKRRVERRQDERRKFVLGDKYVFKVTKSDGQIAYTGKKPDPDSRFFGKLIALTGFSDDRELNIAEIVEQIGGTYKKGSVTKKTDMLLVSQKYSEDGYESTKTKKAIEYAERGLPITLLTEEEFFKEISHEIVQGVVA